jgi:hypothetical protein
MDWPLYKILVEEKNYFATECLRGQVRAFATYTRLLNEDDGRYCLKDVAVWPWGHQNGEWWLAPGKPL